ncbi:MAG: YeeE/YedE family protein [Pseudomonadales bacterium]|nr:YeeE/YedE family protein [Pseudomonadales bacterium]
MSENVAAPGSIPIQTALSLLIAGALFGLGLTISGMTNPAKVIGFLDFFGNWDPSLLLVMAAGLGVSIPGFQFTTKSERPLFETRFYLPTRTDIDAKLLLGAMLFGMGWGLAGFCPGPAITSLISLDGNVFLFVLAMFAGMTIHHTAFE